MIEWVWSRCGLSKFYHNYATTPTPAPTLYADFSGPCSFPNLPVQQRSSSCSLVALKSDRSQLQQEMAYGVSRTRPLTPLVGKFSKSKVSPKKKFARFGSRMLLLFLEFYAHARIMIVSLGERELHSLAGQTLTLSGESLVRYSATDCSG